MCFCFLKKYTKLVEPHVTLNKTIMSMSGGNKTEASKRIIDETRQLYSTVLSVPLSDTQLKRPTFSFIQDLAKRVRD